VTDAERYETRTIEARRYSELEALYAVAGLSAVHTDPSEIIKHILRVVEEVTSCDRALLFVHQTDADRMDVYSSVPVEDDRVALADTGIIGRIWMNQSVEIVNDSKADPDSQTSIPVLAQARQLIGAPLTVGENRVGVVAALNSRRGAFSDEDLRVVSILGDRIALTLENSQLLKALQRQVLELEGLQKLAKLLTSADAVERVIGESIRIVLELLSCEKSAILLFDEESNCLVAHPPVFGISDEELTGLKISLDEPSLGATVFRTNTALASNDAETDAWVTGRIQELLSMHAVLVVPLTTGAQPIGILMAVDPQKGYFDDMDLEFTSLLGRQIAAILESSLSRQREKELMKQLKEADRTKTEFVSMLAHELKGPMTTIMGFATTLKDQRAKLSDEKQDHILSIVAKEIERLSRLVNDLLDVSRMEAGSLKYDLEPMSFFEVVEGVLTVHTSLRSMHAVASDIQPDFPKVVGDKDRIRQVMINLLTNATRYSHEGTTITISGSLSEDGRTARIAVADEGIGVPEADRERVFDKFAMLPKPGWVKKGTGLGLFITKGIIEAHGGRIWVEEGDPKGTVFVFTLPVTNDEASG
jgi:K+-sensing histidine kinase KdpD